MNFVPQLNQSTVDCEWTDYGAWSECNATCGGGFKIRYRKKIPGNGEVINCVGSSKEVKQCALVPCKNKNSQPFSSNRRSDSQNKYSDKIIILIYKVVIGTRVKVESKNITLPSQTTTIEATNIDSSHSYTYRWTMVEAIPKTNTITMKNAETKVLTLSGLMAGIYRFKLTATSDSGLKEVATATITVLPGMKNIILKFRKQDYT